MKCQEMSKGSLGAIELCLKDIFNDKSSNSLEVTLQMMEDQINMVREIEGLKK